MAIDEAVSGKRRRAVVDFSESDESRAPGDPRPDESPAIQDKAPKDTARVPRARKAPAREKPKSRSVEDVDRYAYDVLNTMKDMYRRDCQASRENRPALLKIEGVDTIYQRVIKKETQEACIKLGVLGEIRVWLEPLPDNSLPNQKVKKVLLELLSNLRITKSDLLSSGVGRIVHFYSKNAKEAKDVRKMALDLLRKWKALVIREEMEE